MIKFTYALKLVNSFVNWKVHFQLLNRVVFPAKLAKPKAIVQTWCLAWKAFVNVEILQINDNKSGEILGFLKDNRTIASRETLCSHLIQYTLSRWSFPVILKIQDSQAWKSSLWWVSKLLKKCQNWKKNESCSLSIDLYKLLIARGDKLLYF